MISQRNPRFQPSPEASVTSFLEIMFADNGVGIPEENLPKIFDPFFSTREGTSGLGLAIVHNILDMHKGAIHVERGSAGPVRFSPFCCPVGTSGRQRQYIDENR